MSQSSSQISLKGNSKSDQNPIPQFLVKETIEGIPFYYANYREVLNKTKNLEEIMADSGLQAFIKRYIFALLLQSLDSKKYDVFMGEVGSHIDRRNNMGLDIAIFDRKILTRDKINTKYIDVAPKVVIEVDVNVEGADETTNLFEDFVLRKVRQLNNFGTEKIIWIFTKSKTVIVASPDNNWKVLDWNTDIEILEGIQFNIAEYLEQEGIES